MVYFSPSLLSADFTQLGRDIDDIVAGGCHYIHCDIMDGNFVPSISMGLPVLRSINKYTDHFLDVHLMIANPERYFQRFADAGADLITFHYEATEDVAACIKQLKDIGVKIGLSICPDTPVESIYPFLNDVDMILVMTVNPGFGGQKFIEKCGDKVKQLRAKITELGLDVNIQVDGGITKENLESVIDMGANVIVAGSAVFVGDTRENMKELMSIINKFNS